MSFFGNQKLFGTQTSGFLTGTSTPSLQTGFNLPSTSTSFSGFGFGSNPPNQNAGLFQSPLAKSTASVFGAPAPTNASFSGFGANIAKTTASLFPNFATPASTQALGLFGTQSTFNLNSSLKQPQAGAGSLFTSQTAPILGGTPGLTGLQQPALQQQQQQQQSLDAFFGSLSQPLLFGDERDTILAKWNQLQAMWGTGIGYCTLGVATYTPDNTFARFKSIAYNMLPSSTDADGLICLYLSKPFSEVLTQRQGLQDYLFRLLGGKPNLQLVLEEIRPCAEESNHSEVILRVIERQPTGNVINVSSSELARYLSSQTVASQLQSQLCVYKLTSEVCPSASQLAAYNENPPAGIDRHIWEQARLDNPFPDRLIPVPLVGFADLRRRTLDQISFNQQQSHMLKNIGEVVQKMKTDQLAIAQKLAQFKRKQVELSHRVLQVLRRQELHRRGGFAVSAEEEALRCGLERIWNELTSSRGLRIRFQDVSASYRASLDNVADAEKENAKQGRVSFRLDGAGDGPCNWDLDADSWAELKEYLSQRQTGIREMQHLLTEMSATLKVMEDIPNSASAKTHNKLPLLFHTRTNPNKVSFALGSR